MQLCEKCTPITEGERLTYIYSQLTAYYLVRKES